MNSSADTKSTSSFLSWLQLVRLPTVFTAWADIGMGFTLALGHPPTMGAKEFLVLPLLILSTTGLYWAGMILNDVYDVEQDRKERPNRPLPSGRIPIATAQSVGFGLLATGVLCAAAAGVVQFGFTELAGRPTLIALGIAIAVWLYDAVAKSTGAAPIMMGACRTLNALLGMSIATSDSMVFTGDGVFEFSRSALLIAGGLGLFIAGVTWFAWREGSQSHRPELISATLTMLVGVVLISLFPAYLERGHDILLPDMKYWPYMLLFITLIQLRSCGKAIATTSSADVQRAVKSALLTLVVFDAAIAAVVGGVVPGILVVLLVLPALFLGRWIYST